MIALPRSLDESSLVHGRLGFGTPRWAHSTGYGVDPAVSVLGGLGLPELADRQRPD
jgi:hypothetical protein